MRACLSCSGCELTRALCGSSEVWHTDHRSYGGSFTGGSGSIYLSPFFVAQGENTVSCSGDREPGGVAVDNRTGTSRR